MSQVKSHRLHFRSREVALSADERLPLGLCWLIWIGVSLALWSLVAGFVF